MNTQGFAKLTLGGIERTVLVRENSYRRSIKIAKSPHVSDYNELTDEQNYLDEHPELVKRLLAGETIYI